MVDETQPAAAEQKAAVEEKPVEGSYAFICPACEAEQYDKEGLEVPDEYDADEGDLAETMRAPCMNCGTRSSRYNFFLALKVD